MTTCLRSHYTNEFVIDMKDACYLIGQFSSVHEYVESQYVENVGYKIENGRLMLNVQTFIELCIESNNQESKKFVGLFVQNKQETYQEYEKTGNIYILRVESGGPLKIGRSKNVSKRVGSLQCGHHEKIEVLYVFSTSNDVLLERIIHVVLEKYRCNSGREFFNCNFTFAKNALMFIGNAFETLMSSLQDITLDEIFVKFKLKFEEHKMDLEVNNSLMDVTGTDEQSDFDKWLRKNIVVNQNAVLNLTDICKGYLGKKAPSRIASKYKT